MMKIISELPKKDEGKFFPKHPKMIYKVLRFLQIRLYTVCILSNILVPPLYWLLVFNGGVPAYYS